MLITLNVWAVEPIYDQQATFYYQIPFGGVNKADNTHKFGFRVDRVAVDRSTGQYSDSISFNDLMKKPASLDMQMGHQGISAFKMHGHDYLPQFVSQADDEGGQNGGENGEAAGGQENGEASEAEKSDEKKYLKLPEMNQTNIGILLGVGILIIAITL